MSRLDEVEASIKWIMSAGMTGGAITPNMRDLCRILAAEVDELRGKLAIMEDDMCAAAGELLVPFPQPGSIDAKLLIANRLLKGEIAELRGKLDALRAEADPQALVICHMQGRAEGDDVITKLLDLTAPHVDEFGNRQWWQYKRPEQMHARACEIAGRTE